jgi:hypothetical protein
MAILDTLLSIEEKLDAINSPAPPGSSVPDR